MPKFKKIGVLTSGGDSPGMNAAIRAIVRAAIYNGIRIFGIYEGYEGMINGDIRELKSTDVSNIIQRGGTILKSARCEEFKTKSGRKKAYNQLIKNGIEAVVVIGGDGTFKGAKTFSDEYDIPFVGLPGTIDNDLYGTDMTIGFDTALNTIVDAVDKIRDTASSHNRLFFIEVMGKDVGFMALRSGVTCGAEAVLIPEVPTHLDTLRKHLEKDAERKKSSNIVLVAEGDDSGGAFEIAKKVRKEFKNYDVKVTILGHIQRGGSPTSFDRYLASILGIGAIDALLEDQKSVMIGYVDKEIVNISFAKTTKHHKTINKKMLKIIEILNV